MDILNNYNKAILGIPAMWTLSWATHAWAINIATGGSALKWDNRNPRSAGLKKRLQDKLSAEQYAKYERAEAASANLLENLPLFTAAVLLGTIAKLDQAVMDRFAGYYLAARAVYAVNYVLTSKQQYTPVRSLLWFASVGLCIRTIVSAAKVLR